MEPRVQGRSAVPQRLLHERVVPLRRVDVDSRRHLVAGGVELGQRLRPRRPERSAARRARTSTRVTASRSPAAMTSRSRAASRSPRRRSTAASPAVRGRRTTRPTTTATCAGPTTCSTSRRAPSEFTFTSGTFEDLMAYVNAEPCLADYIGKIHERNACRAPWINTFDMRVNVGLPFKRLKAEITWDLLNLINLFDQQRRPARVRELQRPARRAARRSPTNADHVQPVEPVPQRRAPDAGGTVHEKRSAVALADAAGRADSVLGRLRFRDQEFGLRETQRAAIPGARARYGCSRLTLSIASCK